MERLSEAWKQVYKNGIKSTSIDTKNEILEFKKNEIKNLRKIQRLLQQNKFKFENSRGILLKRKGKDPRPIVIASVQSRIVQRSILDVLQENSSIKKYYLSVPTSYGAIKGEDKGVRNAIIATIEAIKNGAEYFYKSDIASFFTKIAIPKVIEVISTFIPDKDFVELLRNATILEISNLNDLGDLKHYFIFDDIGTPQGCCLSPLLGNIFLAEFDKELNKNDIICLRYLDDFILLAPTEKAVRAAFRRASKILAKLSLEAYTAVSDPKKAKVGYYKQGFEFLGVEILNKLIRPNKASCNKLLNEIKEIIKNSLEMNFSMTQSLYKEEYSVTKTLYHIHNKIKGWGNQYYFCNDRNIFITLDEKISGEIDRYLNSFLLKREKLDAKQKRKQLGIHLLIDSKNVPIT